MTRHLFILEITNHNERDDAQGDELEMMLDDLREALTAVQEGLPERIVSVRELGVMEVQPWNEE